MRTRRGLTAISGVCRLLAGAALVLSFQATAAQAETTQAQSLTLGELLSGVVHIKTHITPDGRTTENLGREREGTGVVIDDNGLVLTIGYLMVEAVSAEVITSDGHTVAAQIVGYDNESGFGLLQTLSPLHVRALKMGTAAAIKDGDPVLVASHGGFSGLLPVHVVAKREFAGSWEYLLDEAIFTAPTHPAWSGAALIGHDGKLLGVGSLVVSDVAGKGGGESGNMFVPIDRLAPVLAELLSDGRPAVTRPWLGVSTSEVEGRLVVSKVAPGAPGEKAGVKKGDVIVAVNGEAPKDLSDFYRKVWSLGHAGVDVPLDVMRDEQRRSLTVHSISRLDHLKLNSSF
jgi:S1-C subfamily serine protease